MLDPKVGDHVRIIDHSDAHGDTGVIWHIQDNDIILVELDNYNCIWPVMPYEIEMFYPETKSS